MESDLPSARSLEFFGRSVEAFVSGKFKRDPTKARTILVLYRCNVKSQLFEAGNDTWMFLSLSQCHYGLCGRSLDCVMLMDGITKVEVITEPTFVAILPCLKPNAVIMEAG